MHDFLNFVINNWWQILLTVMIAYLLGSINFAIIITNIVNKNKDIREMGSGNAGFTNVLRSVGKVPAIFTIVFDFLKAVIASKEDEIKKGQQIFIRRLITGIIVFFIFSLVKLFISVVGDSNNKANVINCFSCIINNDENCVAGV